MLAGLGWRLNSGEYLDRNNAALAAHPTREVLRRLGCLADEGRFSKPETLNADGDVFACAAAGTWPGYFG
jgi:hypothetical protein